MISSPPPPLHPGRRFNSATVPMHLSQIGDLSHRQTRQFRREMSQKHCTFLSIEIAEATPGFHNWTDVTGIWAFPSRCPCGGLNHPFLFLINLVMWPKYLIYQSLNFFFFPFKSMERWLWKKKHILCSWRRKWQPSPVFLSGESQGRGCRLWGCTELETTEAT